MDIRILNQNLELVAIVDRFESFIWTERYSECGDFEIYTPVDNEFVGYMVQDYYVCLKDSEHVMIIEDRQIKSDVEQGSRLSVTGRSLESILDRRIIWFQTILSGNLQDGIKKLLDDNVISPTDQARKIPNFIFEASTDPLVSDLTIDAQFFGENLYDTIKDLCAANNIGFKVILTPDGKFKFKLYSGSDRSYSQLINPYVVFSPNFENLLNSNYVESKKPLKTVALVTGEGEGSNKTTATSIDPNGGRSSIDRREICVSASGVSSRTSSGTQTQETYIAQLIQKGNEELAKHMFISSFEGQIEVGRLFTYGIDYFMGDIVQLANEYGIESRSRVVELVRSQSTSEIGIYPTFSKV